VGIAMLQPLRHRDFRLLWMGQSVSNFGNSLYGVALPFQILALGGSPVQLGTGFAIFSAAQLLVVLVGGAIVDRLPRRSVILTSDLVSGLVVGAIAILGATRSLQIPHLYVASAFFGVAFSFYMPAMTAIMPELVPKDILVAGNALRSLSAQGARVVGPLIGGVIVAAAGPPIAFALDAGTFIFSFLVFLLAHPPRHEPPAPRPLLSQVRDGVAYTFSVSWVWTTIIGFAITNAINFAVFTVALPLLVLKVLHGTAATFGLIGAAGGVGSIAGALFVGNLRVRKVGWAMYIGNALIGASLIAYGLAPFLPLVLFGSFAFAATLIGANTLWESMLQKHVPGELIGRVSSVDNFGSFLIGPVAPIVAAAVIERSSPSAIFVVGGAISIVFWTSMLAVNRSVRALA
jgi:MFS family permease